jgi:ubiquinone/menaquinone biosynthesis C-methylase UbiE
MTNPDYDSWTDQQLKELEHNDHKGTFENYLNQTAHARDKQDFIFSWVKPESGETIVELGSSGGKTCIDLANRSNCRTLGIDFDEDAILVADKMRDEFFPQLKDRCQFAQGDVSKIRYPGDVRKILMADFTEHIPDRVFESLLDNIRVQVPEARIYIYTPNRDHIFEVLKHNNILLRNKEGHINVKSRGDLASFLINRGWKIVENSWRPSHIPGFRLLEILLGHIPLLGRYFQRRAAIIAEPCQDSPSSPDQA